MFEAQSLPKTKATNILLAVEGSGRWASPLGWIVVAIWLLYVLGAAGTAAVVEGDDMGVALAAGEREAPAALMFGYRPDFQPGSIRLIASVAACAGVDQFYAFAWCSLLAALANLLLIAEFTHRSAQVPPLARRDTGPLAARGGGTALLRKHDQPGRDPLVRWIPAAVLRFRIETAALATRRCGLRRGRVAPPGRAHRGPGRGSARSA